MNVKDFDFELPQELIAQDPLEDRSSSRLLVLDKKTGEIEHRTFRDILSYLRKGDCLVINDTKVIPARLFGVKEGTEAKIEILLLKRRENDIWETLVKPGKKAKIGTVITFGDGLLTGTVVDIVEEGNRLIQFPMRDFEEILDRLARCRFRRISLTSLRTRPAIRPFTQSMKDRQQPPRRDSTSQRTCWRRSRLWESRSPM